MISSLSIALHPSVPVGVILCTYAYTLSDNERWRRSYPHLLMVWSFLQVMTTVRFSSFPIVLLEDNWVLRVVPCLVDTKGGMKLIALNSLIFDFRPYAFVHDFIHRCFTTSKMNNCSLQSDTCSETALLRCHHHSTWLLLCGYNFERKCIIFGGSRIRRLSFVRLSICLVYEAWLEGMDEDAAPFKLAKG